MKLLLIALFLVSCSKPQGPQEILASFVQYRFSDKQDRDKLLDMTEGKLRSSFDEMSDEDFDKFISMPIKKTKFRVISTDCNATECSITYVVGYDTFDSGEKAYTTEVKKIAKIQNFEDGWKIVDVSNIKGFHNSEKPIDVVVE